MTVEETRAALASTFGVEVTSGPVMSITVSPDRWEELGRFAKETLGCRFFSFLTAVDWKEQGLEVVAKVDNLTVAFDIPAADLLGIDARPLSDVDDEVDVRVLPLPLGHHAAILDVLLHFDQTTALRGLEPGEEWERGVEEPPETFPSGI